MIGRLDDFLREVAHDNQAAVSESDIRPVGRSRPPSALITLYRERGYQAVLLVAALRGDYHLTELAGRGPDHVHRAGVSGSFRHSGSAARGAHRPHRFRPTSSSGCRQMPEFVRAYEPDGMTPAEFMAFGATQRTLSQFCEVGLEAHGELPVNGHTSGSSEARQLRGGVHRSDDG